MTNPTAEINAFLEQSRKMAEPMTQLTLLSVQSFEKLARHTYGMAGDALEYSLEALKSGSSNHELPEALKSQTALAQSFIERQNQRAQELSRLTQDIRGDYTRWFETASSEFKAKTSPVADAA